MNGCLLPALFAAHHGLSVAPSFHEPVGLDVVPPPTSEKVVLGVPLANRLDSENFSIQWSSASVSVDTAAIASEALELAWDVLVIDESWGPPTTGDWAKILVYLDPGLSGTGVTTGMVSEENPEGAPVIYLNPVYVEQPDFFRSLAVHEFGHALQFRVRTWYGAAESEPWFWEATSEWMTEVVNPNWDQYAWSSAWYAAEPSADFDSMEGYHQYGMMLLNAYIDEYRGGAEAIWSIWLENEERDWLDEIERVLQEPSIDTWSDFVGAYAAQQLMDSAIYDGPILSEDSGGIAGELGSAYVDLGRVDGVVELTGGVGTMVRGADWFTFQELAEIPEGDGPVTVVVTNPLGTPLEYSLSVRSGDSSGTTTPTEPPSGSPEALSYSQNDSANKGGCACSAGAGIQPVWASVSTVSMCVVLWFRRRSSSPEECRLRSRHTA